MSVELSSSTTNQRAPRLFEDAGQPYCWALNADAGGLNLVAKVTDAAGNVLNQPAQGNWTLLSHSESRGCTPVLTSPTPDSLKDTKRCAGSFNLEFTETTTNLKAKILTNVKSGRPHQLSLSVPPTVEATTAFAPPVFNVSDRWGNRGCTPRYGYDSVLGNNGVSVNFKTRWIGAQPGTPKVRVGATLASETSGSIYCDSKDQPLQVSSDWLQIPKIGTYTLEIESTSLVDSAGNAIPVAQTRQSGTITVYPGRVSSTRLEYTSGNGTEPGEPKGAGTPFPMQASSPADYPHTLQSFNLSYSSVGSGGTSLALYSAGYDREENFSSLVSSSLTSVNAVEDELLAPTEPEYTTVGCTQPSRVICSLSAKENFKLKDKVHVIAGVRAGTSQLRITDELGNSFVLPEFRVVPGRGYELVTTQVDDSKMKYTDAETKNEAIVGSERNFKLRLADSNGNTLKDYSNSANINFQFTLEGSETTAEGFKNIAPVSRPYEFVNGVTTETLSVKLYVADDYFLTAISPITASGSSYGSRIVFSKTDEIVADVFDHYGTITTGAGPKGEYYPHRDLPTDRTFTTKIELRDQFGNVLLPVNGPKLPVSLSLVRTGGGPSGGPLVGTTQNISLSATNKQTIISDLRYPQAGDFKIIATDSSGKTTPLIAASTIEMIPSLDVLKRYEIVRPGGLTGNYTMTAGQMYNFIVRALDLYNQPIAGIDLQLSSFNFQWSGANQALDSVPTAPQWPNQLSFINGAAPAAISFYRAEFIPNGSFQIRDTRSPSEQQQSGSYSGNITVDPGPISEYELLTCINATNCNTAIKSRKAEKSSDGFFDVRIATFDAWKNPRRGDAGLRLVARKVNPADVGPNVSSFLSSTGLNADTGLDTTNINLTSNNGSLTLTNLYYPVGHAVQLDLEGTSIGVTIKPVIQFEYTVNSIDKYKLTFSSNSLTAGPNNVTLTAEAVDKAQNTITVLDSTLNSRMLRITGPNVSPSGQFPTLTNGQNALQDQNWSFTNGTANQSLSLYKAESLAIGGFNLSDNTGVSGANVTPLVISENNASVISYRVPNGPLNSVPTQVAGNAFSLDVTTSDAYGNPSDKNCEAGILIGNGQTSPGGWGGTAVAANVPTPVYFSKGYYRLQNIILNKAGTESLSFTACGNPQAAILVGVSPAGVNRMVLKDSATVPTTDELGLTGSANQGEVACTNPTAGSSQTNCGSVYAFFWDSFGNRIDSANNSCQWSWANASAQHGLTINPPPNLAGSGGSRSISTSDFVDGTLSCTRDSVTKSVKFWGGVAKVDATAAFVSNGVNITTNNVPAGTQLTVSGIRLWASKEGNLVALPTAETNATKQIDFSSTLVIADLPSTVNCTLNSSQCGNSYVGYLRTSGSAGSIGLQVHGKSVSWNNLTVDPGPATQIDVAQVPSNATAGIALNNIKVVMKDQFGNATNTYTNNGSLAQCTSINISFAANLGSSGKNGTTAANPLANPTAPLVGTNRGEYTSTLTLYKTGTNSVTFAGCGVSNTSVISVSPNVAHVGYLSTQSTDNSVSAATTAFDCPNNNDSPSTTAVTCTPINAFFWDAWGNSLNGASPVSCTWNYTNATAQSGLSAAVIPSTTPNGGSVAISATDFIDGTLACTKDGIAAQSKVYGGVSKIEATSSTPPTINNATIVANDNNLSFAGIQLYQRRNGSDVVKPSGANSTFKINVDTPSSTNTFSDIVASGESGRDATNQIITRTFNTSGLSTSGLNLSYKKAPVGNTNSLTLRIQGKAISYTGISIAPNNASKYKFPTVATQTAGSAFGFDVEILDAFDNRTNKNTSGGSCTSSAITLSGSGPSPGNSSTSIGTQTSPDFSQATGTAAMSATAGVYTLGNVRLYRAGGESLTVQACGLSAQSFPVTVVAASAAAGVLRNTSGVSATNETETSCAMHASENRLDCAGKSVFAYFWDQYGNELKDEAAKCDSWSFNNQGRADAVSVTGTAAASVALNNKTPAQTWVDGTLSCNKASLTNPLTMMVWGGVKEVKITAQNSANSDITSTNPTVTAATGNLKITAINLRTTKAGVDTASPINTSRTLTLNTSATHAGWGTGGTASSTKIGQEQNITPTFTNGSHTSSYAFNFIRAESNKSISATAYGLTSNVVGFSVQPANANTIALNTVNGTATAAFPTLTAGTNFSFEAEVRDPFANRTTTSTSGSDCSAATLTVDLPSGQTKASPGSTSTSLGSVSTFNAMSFAPSNGVYTATNVALFNTSNSSLQLSACGVNQSFTVSVSPAVVTNVAVNTSSSASATNITELICDNSGTNNTVKCSSTYVYFWDQYGNRRTADTCDSWSYIDDSQASITPTFSAGAFASQTNLTHASAKFIDGSLRCNNNRNGFATSPSVRLWGGVKSVAVTAQDANNNDITGATSSSPANLTAAIGNARVTQISLQTTKAGQPQASPISNSATVNWSVAGASSGQAWNNTQTSGTNTQISASSQTPSLSFSNGVHTPSPAVSFNFIKPGASNLSASVYGVPSNIVYVNVSPAAANSVTVSSAPPPTVKAGTSFGLELNVRDVFANLTSTNSAGTGSCGAATISGPSASPSTGPAGTTSTSPVLNPASSNSPNSTGVYSISGLILYNAGSSQTLNISACGLNVATAPTVSVTAANASVATLTNSNSRATTTTGELTCTNNTSSPFAVHCSGQAAFAWFWDTYGNQINSTSKSATNDEFCDSWSFTPASGAPSGFSATGANNSLSSSVSQNGSNTFVDGSLSCVKSGVTSPTIQVWGGVKTVAITAEDSSSNNITDTTSSTPANLTAAIGNARVTQISLQTTKAGQPQASPISSSAAVNWSVAGASSGQAWNNTQTSGTNTQISASSQTPSLSFSNGVHTPSPAVSFNFVKPGDSDFRASVYGVTSNVVYVRVAAAAAHNVTVSNAPTSVTAGADFTLGLNVNDMFGNFTSTNCGAVTITGPTASPTDGPSGTASTAFNLSNASGINGPSTLGVYNVTGLKLFDSRAAQVLNISACGLNVASSPSITVKASVPKVATLTNSNSRATSTTGELTCANNTLSPFAVNCSGQAAFAWFWDTYGNQITSSSKSATNDDSCDSWSFTPASGAPSGFAVTGANNSLSSSVSQAGSNTYVDGSLACVKSGVTSPTIQVWGGVKTVAITAVDANNNNISGTPTLTAGVGNIKVNSINLRTTKAGSDVAASVSGTVSVTWNTTATAAGGWGTGGAAGASTPFGQAETNSLSFSNGTNTTTYPFNMVKAESNKQLTASAFGLTSNAVLFSVAPATANSLTLAASPTTITAGQQVTLTVSAKDEFQNPSFSGCTTAELSAVGHLDSPSGSAPEFSSTTLTTTGTTGTFQTATVTLKKAGTGQVVRANACGKSTDSSSLTVNADNLSQILLSTTNAQPTYNTTLNPAADLACTVGTTVTCPRVYAFGEDTFGNPKGAVACGTWTYTTDSGSAPTLSDTSGTSTLVSNAATHIDGSLTCTLSGVSRTVPMFGKIQKAPSFTCGAWACNNTTPVSNCTVANASGYTINSFAFTAGSPSPDVDNCGSALASGNNCSLVFNGTTGQSLANATLQSTPQNPSEVVFSNVTSSIGGGIIAPNCSQTLQTQTSNWTCVTRDLGAGPQSAAELTITYTNPNGMNTFNIASGSPSLTPANGATILNNTCGSGLAPNSSCSVTIRGTTSGSTSTIELAPASGSSFGASSVTTEAAPSCP